MIRRSKLEVFVDILKVVSQEGEIRRTRVMYKANLAWKVLKDSLDVMEKRGIIKSEAKSSGVFVSLTQEGYNVLHRFNEVESAFAPQIQTQAAGSSIFAAAPLRASH